MCKSVHTPMSAETPPPRHSPHRNHPGSRNLPGGAGEQPLPSRCVSQGSSKTTLQSHVCFQILKKKHLLGAFCSPPFFFSLVFLLSPYFSCILFVHEPEPAMHPTAGPQSFGVKQPEQEGSPLPDPTHLPCPSHGNRNTRFFFS